MRSDAAKLAHEEKFASVKLSRDLVRRLKIKAAMAGVPMYLLVEGLVEIAESLAEVRRGDVESFGSMAEMITDLHRVRKVTK